MEPLELRYLMASDIFNVAESYSKTHVDNLDAVGASAQLSEVASLGPSLSDAAQRDLTVLGIQRPTGSPDDFTPFQADRVLLDNGNSFRPTGPQTGEFLTRGGNVRPVTEAQLVRNPNRIFCNENRCGSTLMGYDPPHGKSYLGSFIIDSEQSQWHVYGVVSPADEDRFDVDGDMTVSQFDFDFVIRAIDQRADMSDTDLERCDINHDGFVSAVDALMVANYINEQGPIHEGDSTYLASDSQTLDSEHFTVDRAGAILNYLSAHGANACQGPIALDQVEFCGHDANRDGQISLLDALVVLKELHRQQARAVSAS